MISPVSVCVPLRDISFPIVLTNVLREEGDKVTKDVTLEIELIIVRLFGPILKVPAIVRGAKAVKLLVVKKVPKLGFIAKVAPDPVAKLRDTRLD